MYTEWKEAAMPARSYTMYNTNRLDIHAYTSLHGKPDLHQMGDGSLVGWTSQLLIVHAFTKKMLTHFFFVDAK